MIGTIALKILMEVGLIFITYSIFKKLFEFIKGKSGILKKTIKYQKYYKVILFIILFLLVRPIHYFSLYSDKFLYKLLSIQNLGECVENGLIVGIIASMGPYFITSKKHYVHNTKRIS